MAAKDKSDDMKARNIELADCPIIYDALRNKTKELIEKAISVVDGKMIVDTSIIEMTVADKTRKGYDTTGFRYQRLIDILNETVGSNHWRAESEVIERVMPDSGYLSVAMKVTVQIGNWMPGDKPFFDIVDSKFCYGTGKSKDLGDTYKGAFTNGFKKTVSQFGLGSAAYTGELHKLLQLEIPESDDEYDVSEEPKTATDKGAKKTTPKTTKSESDCPPVEYYCQVTQKPISLKQVQYCEKQGFIPVDYTVIVKHRNAGTLDEIKAKE
jgi:hypothetical protein